MIAIFDGRLRAFQGNLKLSRTGGYGRFRCQWVKASRPKCKAPLPRVLENKRARKDDSNSCLP